MCPVFSATVAGFCCVFVEYLVDRMENGEKYLCICLMNIFSMFVFRFLLYCGLNPMIFFSCFLFGGCVVCM